jgi:hypothetical protein
MTDPAKIAAGLTKAQKKMVLEIGTGRPREYSLGRAGFALMRAKLVYVNELGARHLTNAGRELYAILERASHD